MINGSIAINRPKLAIIDGRRLPVRSFEKEEAS
jgi:hypothetical protein